MRVSGREFENNSMSLNLPVEVSDWPGLLRDGGEVLEVLSSESVTRRGSCPRAAGQQEETSRHLTNINVRSSLL